jgi:Ca-activated chloride channel family protein
MKIFTQHLSTIPAKTEVANLSMQFDAEGDLNQHARMVKTGLLLANLVDLIPAHSNRETYAPYAPYAPYATYEDNYTIRTSKELVSTFSIDVDTGAYSNMRRLLQSGSLTPKEAIRIEEPINYFPYNYANEETQNQPFSISTEIAPSPWNVDTHLLRIGLEGFSPNNLDKKAANLVFLIDVSGSMNSPNKLG